MREDHNRLPHTAVEASARYDVYAARRRVRPAPLAFVVTQRCCLCASAPYTRTRRLSGLAGIGVRLVHNINNNNNHTVMNKWAECVNQQSVKIM